MLLENRVALITGGAKGMGKAMAIRFAAEGCSVAVADIDTDGAENTIAGVVEKGRKGLAIKCDVTDYAMIETLKSWGLERADTE